MTDFEEYIRQGEPGRVERAQAWRTAIGLQAVDGLQTSDYLRQTAQRHIEGEITIDEVRELIKAYYQSRTSREPDEDDQQEADKVSANIAKILSTQTLDFTTNGYIAMHRRIFNGVFKHAGEVRKYDITKKEWVLDGDTVNYLNWEDLRRAIDYDLEQERHFSYAGLQPEETVAHLAKFVSGLWQIHAFREGNTRTTAVFTIQYLRSIGFQVGNDQFAQHSWYFRNALVRANYKNVKKGINYSPVYLERFFRNLLLGEQWDLRNRYLHIRATREWLEQPNLSAPERQASNKQTEQANRTSTEQVPNKLLEGLSPNDFEIIRAVGHGQLSLKQIMEAIGLKHRPTFIDNYLLPSQNHGLLTLLYPDRPRHPRQKYLLTVRGLSLYTQLTEADG